jgi:hypothetical protein
MTALAMVYHPSGFALSADGRFGWGEEPAPTIAKNSEPIDAAQKIFPFKFKGRTHAFAITGASSNNLGTFNLVTETLTALSDGSETCQNVYDLVYKTARHLKDVIETARSNGSLPKQFRTDAGVAAEDGTFTISQIFLAGYFSKKAHARHNETVSQKSNRC